MLLDCEWDVRELTFRLLSKLQLDGKQTASKVVPQLLRNLGHKEWDVRKVCCILHPGNINAHCTCVCFGCVTASTLAVCFATVSLHLCAVPFHSFTLNHNQIVTIVEYTHCVSASVRFRSTSN